MISIRRHLTSRVITGRFDLQLFSLYPPARKPKENTSIIQQKGQSLEHKVGLLFSSYPSCKEVSEWCSSSSDEDLQSTTADGPVSFYIFINVLRKGKFPFSSTTADYIELENTRDDKGIFGWGRIWNWTQGGNNFVLWTWDVRAIDLLKMSLLFWLIVISDYFKIFCYNKNSNTLNDISK